MNTFIQENILQTDKI